MSIHVAIKTGYCLKVLNEFVINPKESVLLYLPKKNVNYHGQNLLWPNSTLQPDMRCNLATRVQD